MERSVAIKKLVKVLGPSVGYRVDDKAPTPEQREDAKAALPVAIAKRDSWKEKRDARYRAILEADQEYQTLRAAHNDAREHVDRLSSMTRHYKITVGVSNSMFFHIKAEGDSWEEVIEKLQA